jgi:hypothetical protein
VNTRRLSVFGFEYFQSTFSQRTAMFLDKNDNLFCDLKKKKLKIKALP